MKQNVKKFITMFITIAILMTSGVICCSAVSWGSYKTVTIKSSDGWVNKFNGPSDYKEKNGNSKYKVYAIAQTMVSNPSVRLINSNGAVRSDSLTIPHTDTIYTGKNNTGMVGYIYYTRTKPAWNQCGSDTMKYKINAQ